jgi:hypothetical protein
MRRRSVGCQGIAIGQNVDSTLRGVVSTGGVLKIAIDS